MADYAIPESYQNKEDLMWIHLSAREFTSQSAYARGNQSINTGKRLATWKLLAPTEIAENVAHEWGEYESIGSRISEKIGDVKKAIGEGKSLTNALNTGLEEVKGKSGNENIAAKRLISKVAGAAAGTSVPKYKIDSSLVYQGSQRREYTLTFNFAFVFGDTSAEESVFEPIRKLEELSCPELDEGLINIQFPAIFKVYTTPGDLIKINHAVLTAVQPTWSAPFKDGYPISCELQLTLQDIEPLYRRSFSEGGIVKVSNSPV